MQTSRNWIMGQLMILCVSTFFSIAGFQFLANQYAYYRYSRDANLPYGPHILNDMCGNSSIIDPDKKRRDEVQKQTANFLATVGFVALSASILPSLLVGYLCDRYGRRLAIAVVLFGQSLTAVGTTFLILLDLPLFLMIMINLVGGLIGGGLICLLVQISVCLTDLTRVPLKFHDSLYNDDVVLFRASQERKRLLFLGILDAVVTVSGSASSAATGAMIDRFGFDITSLVLLGLFGTGLFVLWIMPETQHIQLLTHHPIPRMDHDVSDSSSTTELVQAPMNTEPRQLGRWLQFRAKVGEYIEILRFGHASTLITLIVMLLFALNVFTESQYLFLYLMAGPFCWSAQMVGLYNGLVGTLLAVVSVILTVITVFSMKSRITSTMKIENPSPCNQSEDNIDEPVLPNAASLSTMHVLKGRQRMIVYVIFGILAVVMQKFFMGFAFMLPRPMDLVFVYVALFVCLFRAAVISTLKSFISSIHSADVQGRLFAMAAFSEYVGTLIGIVALPAIYSATVALFPGAVFLLSAGLMCIAVILVLLLLRITTIQIKHCFTKSTMEIITTSS